MKRILRRVLLTCSALLLVIDGLLLLTDTGFGRRTLTEQTEVHFIDVGQGDATLLLSGGQAVLVDAGTPDAGGAVVSYLKALGVKRLYAAVATHPHADHIGGMAQVIEAFPVENFYMGPETANTAAYGKLLDALEARHIRPLIPLDGDELPFTSGASLRFLGPADDVSASNLNDRSIICRFAAGDESVLLMGDAEAAAEQSLLRHHPFLSCDILKVGHHGAATSSSAAFLSAVKPSAAVISCGADNDYGHPSPETLQNLSGADVRTVYNTAEQGTVVLPLDLRSISKENAA